MSTNTDTPTAAPATPPAPAAPPVPKKPYGVAFWVAFGWLAIVLVCAVGGKHLPWAGKPADYITGAKINMGDWKGTFSWQHPLGVSQNGDDWLSAATIGARNSMIIAFATVAFGFLFGGFLGMFSGYMGGKIDAAFTFLSTALLSFPPLLFIIMLLTILSAGTSDSGVAQGLQSTVWKLSLSLGILSIPTLFRVVRASTLQYASREFVTAARAMGASNLRVLFRELLPNVVKPMAAYGLVAAGSVMVIEGGLSYLGIGIGDTWGWGKMISTGSAFKTLKDAPHVSFVPIVILFATVLSFNFIGDKLRERLEVKQGGI